MIKNLKALIPRPKQENKKDKSKPKMLKRIKEAIGNVASSILQNRHFIENFDERATKVMLELDRMRGDRTLCDITYIKEDGTSISAHKIVVSFNEELFQIVQSSNTGHTPVKDEEIISKSIEVEVDTSCISSATSEGDLVKGLAGCDVIERPDIPECEEEKPDIVIDDGDPVEKLEDDNNVTVKILEDDNNVTVEKLEDDNNVTVKKLEDEDNDTVEKLRDDDNVSLEKSEKIGANETLENELSGLVEELAESRGDVTIDVCEVPLVQETSFEDPVEILIHFFYTSHIDITRENVAMLRSVSKQCSMTDVAMACDTFEELASTGGNIRHRYSDPQMPLKMLEHFNKIRSDLQHDDVTVVTLSDKSFRAHKAVLASACSYFRDLIIDNDDISDTISVPDVSESVFQTSLTFLYTASIPVSINSVKNILDFAHTLGLTDVTEGCAEFMEGQINLCNAIEYQKIAGKYQCQKLKNVATSFIRRNFLSLSNTPEFLSVSASWLTDILVSDDVAVGLPAAEYEYCLFAAVRKWVSHDLQSRKKDLYEAMREVRLPLLSASRLLDNVSTDQLVMEDDSMCERVTQAIGGKAQCRSSEQVSMRGSNRLLLIGGSAPLDDETSDGQGYQAVAFNDHVTLYNVTSGRMSELSALPETRSLHCAIAVDNYVIVAGGYDKYSCITNDVMCLDLATLSWKELPPMKVKRSLFALEYLSGRVYAVGGLTPKGYSSKVERYDKERMKWEFVASLPQTFYKHAGCVHQNELVVTGGNDKARDALAYNPEANSWRNLKPMNVGRDSHAAVAAKDKIFVIGGDIKHFSMEEFNSGSECWQVLPEVYKEPVYLCGSSVIGNKIFLVGGWQADDDALFDVRWFDTSTETWDEKVGILPYPRGSLTATTVRVPDAYF